MTIRRNKKDCGFHTAILFIFIIIALLPRLVILLLDQVNAPNT